MRLFPVGPRCEGEVKARDMAVAVFKTWDTEGQVAMECSKPRVFPVRSIVWVDHTGWRVIA